MARIRGLELQFNLAKKEIRSKQDCIVAALHALLINENLQCVGTGEDFPDENEESYSELLPTNWNANQDVYTLRYRSKDKKKRYLIKIVKAGATVMHCNIVENEDATSAMSVNISKYVNEEINEYETAYKDLDGLKEAFQKDIVRTILNPQTNTSKAGTSGSKSPPKTKPVPVPVPRPIDDPYYRDPLAVGGGLGGGVGGFGAFPNIGSSDLNPLGRGGSGMILDPFSSRGPRQRMPPMGLPRGAVPPGARFDPFGPPIRGPDTFTPNRGLFRPPDFDDFM